jgi:hypothetical protein
MEQQVAALMAFRERVQNRLGRPPLTDNEALIVADWWEYGHGVEACATVIRQERSRTIIENAASLTRRHLLIGLIRTATEEELNQLMAAIMPVCEIILSQRSGGC